MSLLCHHTCLLHRNFNKFFLQWVRDGDVKSGRRKATMVLLHCDVARFGVRAVDLVLLLEHDCRESSSPCRVAKNVPDVVVTKDQGGTVEAAHCMVAEHVHLGITNRSTTTAYCGTWKRLVKERHAQPELEGRAKGVRLKTEPEAWNWWRKKPVAGMRH